MTMTPPHVIAALDLSCFYTLVIAHRATISTKERDRAGRLVIRAIAALSRGDVLPEGEKIDQATALDAFVTVCEAMIVFGIDNAELAAAFNNSALRRGRLVGNANG